jgi:hypothetical protein
MFAEKRSISLVTPRVRRFTRWAFGAAVLVLAVGCKTVDTAPSSRAASTSVLGGEVLYQAARGDQPIQGATVEIFLRGQKVGESTTDADGRFRITNLPDEPFQLHVSKGGEYENYEHPDPLDPSAFANGRRFIRVSLEGHITTLVGNVTTADGKPVTGAVIRTYPETAQDVTKADGTFEIRSGLFESMEYRVHVTMSGFEPKLSDSFTPDVGNQSVIGEIALTAFELEKMGTEPGELDEGGGGAPGVVTPGDQ